MVSRHEDTGAIGAPNDEQTAQKQRPDQESLLPVRMLNEFAYCPRLYHLMHVEGRWADNQYTVDGKYVHRRVDKLDHVLPEADTASRAGKTGETSGSLGKKAAVPEGASRGGDDDPPAVARSVPLGSEALGITAKLDLVSCALGPDGVDEAVPVETKRGRVPNNPERSWEPERVQLMAQGLLLREHGYRCDHGVLYFVGSRTRVDVPFTEALETRTRQLIQQATAQGRSRQMPEPLEDSPKCNGCSLNGICLPDETRALQTLRSGSGAVPAIDLKPGEDCGANVGESAGGASGGVSGGTSGSSGACIRRVKWRHRFMFKSRGLTSARARSGW